MQDNETYISYTIALRLLLQCDQFCSTQCYCRKSRLKLNVLLCLFAC